MSWMGRKRPISDGRTIGMFPASPARGRPFRSRPRSDIAHAFRRARDAPASVSPHRRLAAQMPRSQAAVERQPGTSSSRLCQWAFPYHAGFRLPKKGEVLPKPWHVQIHRHVLALGEAVQHPLQRELPPDAALLVTAIRMAGLLAQPLVHLHPAGLDGVGGA